jgi:hypothetical protein
VAVLVPDAAWLLAAPAVLAPQERVVTKLTIKKSRSAFSEMRA